MMDILYLDLILAELSLFHSGVLIFIFVMTTYLATRSKREHKELETIPAKWEFLMILENEDKIFDPSREEIVDMLRQLEPAPDIVPLTVTSTQKEIEKYLEMREEPEFPTTNFFGKLYREDGYFLQVSMRKKGEFYIENFEPLTRTLHYAFSDDWERLERTFTAFGQNDDSWWDEFEWIRFE